MSKSIRVPITNTLNLSISLENTKLGKIPNFNLPPGKTCSTQACKSCLLDGCYAMKAYRIYPSCRAAWDMNLDCVKRYPERVKDSLLLVIRKYKPAFFRIHSAGDFFTSWYFWMWLEIVRECPDTAFLAFSKQFDIIRTLDGDIPHNLIIKPSGWHDIDIPDDLIKTYGGGAYCVEEGDTVPENAIECPGDCRTCHYCYKSTESVYFHKH